MDVPISSGEDSSWSEDDRTKLAKDAFTRDLPNVSREVPQQSGGALAFIDEGEKLHNAEHFKRRVRSHVRRGIHARQRRMNEASRPRVLGPGVRRIVQKSGDSEGESAKLPSPQAIVDAFCAPSGSGSQTPISDSSPQPTYQTLVGHHRAGSSPSTAPLESMQFSQSSMLSQAEIVPYSTAVPRQQFNTNKCQRRVLATPYALLLGNGAPTLQMQGRNWPFLHPIRGNGPALSVWMPGASIPIPNARAPRPCLLKSAKTVSWIAESVDYFRFKDEVIKWVNITLGKTNEATSEITMGVILCLMSWEISRGNTQELSLHWNGLLRMINLRGGLLNLASIRQFCWKLQLIDILVALQTNTQPQLPTMQLPAPTPPPYHNRSIDNLQTPDSPLFGDQPFHYVLSVSPFDAQTTQLLLQMRFLTDGYAHYTEPLPGLENPTSLAKIIHFASKIYIEAFAYPPTFFSSFLNTTAVSEIAAGLEDVRNDGVWTRYPGILLWIVLTGYAAAANLPERSYFAMYIFRVGTSAVWWGMDAASSAMRTFIEVKKRAEGLAGT